MLSYVVRVCVVCLCGILSRGLRGPPYRPSLGEMSGSGAGALPSSAPSAPPPGIDSVDASKIDDWSAGGGVHEEAAKAAALRASKKADGKAGVVMASFNLSNAVRSDRGGAHSRPEDCGLAPSP